MFHFFVILFFICLRGLEASAIGGDTVTTSSTTLAPEEPRETTGRRATIADASFEDLQEQVSSGRGRSDTIVDESGENVANTYDVVSEYERRSALRGRGRSNTVTDEFGANMANTHGEVSESEILSLIPRVAPSGRGRSDTIVDESGENVANTHDVVS